MTDDRPATPVTTIIPARPARGAKSRLAEVLDDRARADLARTLLVHTVTVARAVGDVLVVSSSRRMRDLAAANGATPVVEEGTGLDAAVSQGLARASADGVGTALVLPADLPRLAVADLVELLALVPDGPGVVVVPCQREDGTNALVVRPPDAITPRYGPASSARHVTAAQRAGLATTVHRSSGFVDLDLPEDWRRHGIAVAGRGQAGDPARAGRSV